MTQTPADLMKVLGRLDLVKLGRVAQRVDLAALLDAASRLDDRQLEQLTKLLQEAASKKHFPLLTVTFSVSAPG
ncbi:hypothetical protein [Deinococcus peraridilitoris]|uniref:Uncharacterized protein n=1 Tax=Deinococcus peraridilitoris (strain DSM 19664 / LMG 22246 / CIP 109416 / KR-200) TaxID=937777 RepID=L0A6J4_DEIPD|nr:hypothetical protein [Deinococcus peraridilitoris]AFZ68807.1 hypothetical protein Deipe_3367 [Deinococcus peraridilitoris DSM 19664]